MNVARETAKDFIRPYVERCDPITFLRAMGGCAPGGYDVSISGYMPIGSKWWSNDWILVYRDRDGREVNAAFKLKDIYEEVKSGQVALL